MPILVNNFCHKDIAPALDAIRAQFPFFSTFAVGTTVTYNDRYLTASTLDAFGKFTYSTKNQLNVVTQTNAFVQYPTCTVPTLLDQDFYFVALITVIVFLGAVVGFGIPPNPSRMNTT